MVSPCFFSILFSHTGSGHIFSCISSGKRVCTLSGFSNSPAIFASSLLLEIPTFTVNPRVSRISSFSRCAVSRGLPNRACVPVMSAKASSMLYCSTTSEYLRRISMKAPEFLAYNSRFGDTTVRFGHFRRASTMGSPVRTSYLFAGMDFASMTPCRLDMSPPTAEGIVRRSSVSPRSRRRCTASQDRNALFTSIWKITLWSMQMPLLRHVFIIAEHLFYVNSYFHTGTESLIFA